MPASGIGIGGGHVMRCLTLARQLRKKGAMVVFATGAEGRDLLGRFALNEFSSLCFQTAPERLELIQSLRPKALVLDDYGCDVHEELRLRPYTTFLMVLDDLANRHHACDILLDPSFGRKPEDYRWLAPNAVVLPGPDYALIGEGFIRNRPKTLPEVKPDVEHILISFGLSAVWEITQKILFLLKHCGYLGRITVILPGEAQKEAESPGADIRDYGHRLSFHYDSHSLSSLMQDCDLCIGAGGVSVWERACLGKPSLIVTIADNQTLMAKKLAEHGLCLTIKATEPHFSDHFYEAFSALQNQELRKHLAQTGWALCDGLGAERASQALLKKL